MDEFRIALVIAFFILAYLYLGMVILIAIERSSHMAEVMKGVQTRAWAIVLLYPLMLILFLAPDRIAAPIGMFIFFKEK